MDDIVVGAPWYTDPSAAIDYEVGMVSVYAQTEQVRYHVYYHVYFCMICYDSYV